MLFSDNRIRVVVDYENPISPRPTHSPRSKVFRKLLYMHDADDLIEFK